MYPVGLVFAGEAASGSYGVGGLASAGFSLAGAAAKPVGGQLIDRFGQRLMARVLLAIFVGNSVGLLIVIRFAPATWLIVSLAIAAGLTVPNVGALTRARWVGMVERSDLERSQALEAVNDEINFIVGPTAVSIAAATLAAWIPLLGATALSAVGTLGVTSLPTEPRAGGVGRMRVGGWITPHRIAFLSSVAGLGMILGGVTVTVVAYTAELGHPASAALIFALNAGASLVAALVVGRMGEGDLPSRYRKATLWLLLVLIPYSWGTGIVWFAAAGFVAGLGTSPTLIQANSLVASTTSLERRTEAFSWIAAAVGIGIAAGSAIAGLLVDFVGAGHTRAWITVFAVIPAAVTVGMRLIEKRRTS